MNIRQFRVTDTPVLIDLFRNTVRTVCRKDYSTEQLFAWAPNEIDELNWTKRFLNSFTLIAEETDIVFGFANLENDGNVDMLYVHASRQGNGIGKQLFAALEVRAQSMKLEQLHSDVSITARPFFSAVGFTIDKEYVKSVRGSEFKNVLMSKRLKK